LVHTPNLPAPTRILVEETTYIEKFLFDINKPENDTHKAALPNIAAILQKLETVNERLEGLYQQRLQTLHDLEQLGKSADIRKDVDKRLIEFIDDMNAIHRSNELGDKDAALKTKLESSASYIEALVEQTERVLSRRDHHHKSSNETPAETEPSNPPANPPEQKPEDPQAPNTTLPQAPDMPPQQPSATPPPINPEDLNPPAAGE
ncbi:MAG: DUF6261 family protein, partial [Tannerellaceae bacterium]|nr:DUF6261 family protein [Tannerellaceae bacterium]